MTTQASIEVGVNAECRMLNAEKWRMANAES
jgi:hypothetical protein